VRKGSQDSPRTADPVNAHRPEEEAGSFPVKVDRALGWSPGRIFWNIDSQVPARAIFSARRARKAFARWPAGCRLDGTVLLHNRVVSRAIRPRVSFDS